MLNKSPEVSAEGKNAVSPWKSTPAGSFSCLVCLLYLHGVRSRTTNKPRPRAQAYGEPWAWRDRERLLVFIRKYVNYLYLTQQGAQNPKKRALPLVVPLFGCFPISVNGMGLKKPENCVTCPPTFNCCGIGPHSREGLSWPRAERRRKRSRLLILLLLLRAYRPCRPFPRTTSHIAVVGH